MVEKSFATCFDKDCEEYANTLMTLVSKDKSICNIKTSREEFKKDRSIVSGEYVLTIGEKGSAYNKQNFKDIYNDYGIHIGYYGAKAWISCESFKWDEESLFKFHTELISVLDELGMNTDNIDDRAKEFLKEQKKIKKNIDSYKNKNIQPGDVAEAFHKEAYEVLMTSIAVTNILQKNIAFGFAGSIFLKVEKWFSDFLKKSERRKQQYRYAIVLFYYRYIHEFLELDEKNNEDNNKKMDF
jgi:hypothetical protein